MGISLQVKPCPLPFKIMDSMACYFCKKRIWFWQDELWTYHLACYRNYLHNLLDEMPPDIFSPFDISPEFSKQYRDILVKEIRELNRFIPRLNLHIPIVKK
jgi:hypothetical protein